MSMAAQDSSVDVAPRCKSEEETMDSIQRSTRSRGILTGLLGGLAAAALMATAALAPKQAVAKPEYAAQTKLPCAGCHVNATGGGPLNTKGKKFQASGHKL
jgi:hypothetical protein